MSRPSSLFVCRDCDVSSPRWVGRCLSCGSWNSLEERVAPLRAPARGSAAVATALADVADDEFTTVPTGVREFDRVLGGGFVPGSTTLLFGEPGIGKSTLALMSLLSVAARGATVLLIAAEESVAQVARRARRLGVVPAGVNIVATADVDDACALICARAPTLVVVDSVSALRDSSVGGVSGAVAHVRVAAERLCCAAKTADCAVLLVGHVTKDGELSGPRALEHLVDTVIRIEGDRQSSLRLVRALKHRFGSTDEVGLLEMGVDGLRELATPVATNRSRSEDVPGVVVTVTTDGSRSMLVEVQALVASSVGAPRRVAHRVSAQRLSLMLAVLESRCNTNVAAHDVFAATAGGLPAAEPANDLALALAIASAAQGFAVAATVAAVGEVGLTGEIRPVGSLTRRVREAARLGCRTVLVPSEGEFEPVSGVEVRRCRTLSEAINVVRESPGESDSDRL